VTDLRGILWRSVGRFAFRCSPHLAYGWRRAVLRAFGARITPRTKFRRSVRIDRPWRLTAGALTVFGDEAVLRGPEAITIGSRCVISQYAILSTEQRDPARPGAPAIAAPIRVEDDAWVAADVLVQPGSIVRAGAVVGSRGRVAGEVPAWKVCVGDPAQPRGTRVLTAPEVAA
jgi:putative colanic acid biosynthesis acetyltransferase WcaF